MVAAVKGYRLILVMPESMSIERRRLMSIYGAEFVLTPREKGMKGAIEKAQELTAEIPHAWSPLQFENPANIEVHKKTTAQEIIKAFPNGLDYLITGVGTGGHITGCAEILKAHYPNLKVFAVEPEASPVISGGSPAPHPIQGIGAGFIPTNLHTDVLDGAIQVSKDDAFSYAQRAAKEEGILLDGIGIQLHCAIKKGKLFEQPGGENQEFNFSSFKELLNLYKKKNISLHITEFDIALSENPSSEELENQGKYYAEVIKYSLISCAVKTFKFWGISDKYSWIRNSLPYQASPLLYDTNFEKKPALLYLKNMLQNEMKLMKH
jgi:hypothetical protein